MRSVCGEGDGSRHRHHGTHTWRLSPPARTIPKPFPIPHHVTQSPLDLSHCPLPPLSRPLPSSPSVTLRVPDSHLHSASARMCLPAAAASLSPVPLRPLLPSLPRIWRPPRADLVSMSPRKSVPDRLTRNLWNVSSPRFALESLPTTAPRPPILHSYCTLPPAPRLTWAKSCVRSTPFTTRPSRVT